MSPQVSYLRKLAKVKTLMPSDYIHQGHCIYLHASKTNPELGTPGQHRPEIACSPFDEDCERWSVLAAVQCTAANGPEILTILEASVYRALQSIYAEEFITHPQDQRMFMMLPGTTCRDFLLNIDWYFRDAVLADLLARVGL